MNLYKKISLGVLFFILLVLGTVLFLISTTSGLHIFFNIASYWVPELKFGQVSGNWHNICLKNIIYNWSGITISADEFHLSVKLGYLISNRFYINDMSLRNVHILINLETMSKLKKTEENKSILNISRSYPVTINHIKLHNINIKTDNSIISVMDLISGIHWQEKNLTLKPTFLRNISVTILKTKKTTKKKLIESKIRNLQLQKKSIILSLKEIISESVSMKTTNLHIPLNFNIEEFKIKKLRIVSDIDIVVRNILLKVNNVENNIYLNTLDIDSDQGIVNATGNVQLHDNWPINITMNGILNNALFKNEKIKLKIDGFLLKRTKIKIDSCGPINIGLYAQTQLADTGLPVDINIITKQFFWPFNGKKLYQVDNFELKLKGKITDYTLSFHMSVIGQNIPPTTINLEARGNNQRINFDKLTITILEGKAELIALLDWQEAVNWYGELKFNSIDIGKKVPYWSSKLDGFIKASGSFYDDKNWQMDVNNLKITGNINQQRVRVDGTFKNNSYLQWTIPDLHAVVGQNNMDIKGELGIKNLDLSVIMNMLNLDNIFPGIGGVAKCLVKLHGTIESPQLLANITANNLLWQNLSVDKVNIYSDMKFIHGNSKLKVCIKHITKPGMSINLLTLDAKGNYKKHDLQLQIQGKTISGQSHLKGWFDLSSRHWKGQIDNAVFNTMFGSWTLSRSVILDYNNTEQKINIKPHCWNNLNAEICVSQIINIGTSNCITMNINYFDLAIFKSLMPNTIQTSGMISGKLNLVWHTSKENLSHVSLIFSGCNLKVTKAVNTTLFPIIFNVFKLKADIYNNCVELSWLIRPTNNSKIDGQILISDMRGARNISGNINSNNFNLAIANIFFSHGEKLIGILNTSLRIAGNVTSPKIFGQIQFDGLDIESNFMPIDMQPSQLKINFDGIQWKLQGKICTQQGYLNLNGDAKLNQIDNWRIRISVKGNRIRVTMLPMLLLDISPDVNFLATSKLFIIDGYVDVPWARIVAYELPKSAVYISRDSVLLNKNMIPVKTKSVNIPINCNIILHVGNDVRMDVFGLRAKLNSNLKIVQYRQGLGLNGQINITDGRFHAYGQDLLVRKGEILFSGPLDQPFLSIEAIRNPESTEDDIIAGVRITGVMDKPKIEIFSDPIMPQQEALSYLLRGHRLGRDQNDQTEITSMLVELSISQGSHLISRIGDTLGLGNLVLDTKGSGDSSQVVISGYVLPDLQVKYGIRIFDSLKTFTLRYRLISRLYLELASGIDQALDLIYKFEF